MTPPKLVSTAKTYEELDGGQGREVFFRPHRYRAQDLEPLQARVALQGREFPLRDVSQNGAAVEWPAGAERWVRARLEHIEVLFDDRRAYAGEARAGSVRGTGGAGVIGIRCGAGPLGDS